jgi:hypothetical protein
MTQRVHNPQEMSFLEWVELIISECRFEGYSFHVIPDRSGAKIQATYLDADIGSGLAEVQYTRKWLVSPFSCESEIARTVFKCCLTSMEHRTREGFFWKDARIFGPHIDIYALYEAAQKVDVREPDRQS